MRTSRPPASATTPRPARREGGERRIGDRPPCIPSKTLLRPGEAVQAARDAGTAEVDVEAALAWRDLVVSDYSDAGQERWLADHGTGFPPSLSAKAERSLRRLGVTPVLGSTVVDVDEAGVTIAHADDATRRVPARTVVWAAGVTASGLASQLAELTGAEQDRAGRVTVEPDLTLPGHPEVFAVGDMVRVRGRDGSAITFPGVAPVAMQQGRYAARAVRARLQGRTAPPFRYRDKGNLATIGRAAAVADIKGVRLSGFLAWITWLVVHLFYLVGFQNRLLVLIRWSISFATRGRGARLITDPTDAEAPARPLAHPEPGSTLSMPPSEVSAPRRSDDRSQKGAGRVRVPRPRRQRRRCVLWPSLSRPMNTGRRRGAMAPRAYTSRDPPRGGRRSRVVRPREPADGPRVARCLGGVPGQRPGFGTRRRSSCRAGAASPLWRSSW
jgi:Pyridine nucleotide-disulphide oxidoreductase/NDH2 C-terminal domain